MNLRQLKTLTTFLEHGSFSAVGDQIGLSHSAVSVQMQQLEEELKAELFDRSSKPPKLTPIGTQIAIHGRNVLDQIDKIRMVASGQNVAGSISIGFVPTTLQTLLPVVLDKLQKEYPEVRAIVKSGLSGELAASVIQKELDFAILTSPITEMPDLHITEIGSEALYVIGPSSKSGETDDADLVRSMPFIAFNKKTWLGQQIAARLQYRGIYVDEVMEVDSLDAIEKLVEDGFGVSIIPHRLRAKPLSEKLTRVPFGDPVETRKLVLIRHAQRPQTLFEKTIRQIVSAFSNI